MDPIHPISPRPPAILPVSKSRVGRATREHSEDPRGAPQDRFTKQEDPTGEQHPGEQPPPAPPPPASPRQTYGELLPTDSEEGRGPNRIDVRA